MASSLLGLIERRSRLRTHADSAHTSARHEDFSSSLDDLTVLRNRRPEQISEAANGDIIVAGFSDPSGIYRYNSAGVEIDFIDVGPFIRGVYELANGNFLFTNFSGVFVVNPNTLFVTTIVKDGNNRFIELVDLPAKSRLTNLGPHSSLFLGRFHYLYGCSI